jgi:hypothetical protein
MCNFIHDNFSPLKELSGFGYKLFYKLGIEYYPILGSNPFSIFDINIWNSMLNKGDGFCFFPSLDEAKRAAKDWNNLFNPIKPLIVEKIKYYNGLAEQDEKGFIGDKTYRIGICTAFEIINEGLTKEQLIQEPEQLKYSNGLSL